MPKRTNDDQVKQSNSFSALAVRKSRNKDKDASTELFTKSALVNSYDMNMVDVRAPTRKGTSNAQPAPMSARVRIQKKQQEHKDSVEDLGPGTSIGAVALMQDHMDIQMSGNGLEGDFVPSVAYERQPGFHVSSMIPSGHNYVRTSHSTPLQSTILVKMRYKETLVFQGEYAIEVHSGSISICGTIARSSQTLRIFAPTIHSLPVIECSRRSKKRKLEDANLEDAYDAVFTVKSTNSGLCNIDRICPIFKSIWGPSDIRPQDSFTPVFSSPTPVSVLQISPLWQKTATQVVSVLDEALETSSALPVILIAGSKSTGKSTFSRYLVNVLNTSWIEGRRKVAYLDLDPGQPSFGPPCGVGLYVVDEPVLGPPFTSIAGAAKTLKEHHIGYISPREDPQYYVNCALDLLEQYRKDGLTAGMPLVINTPGWIKGMGREMLQEIVSLAALSDIVVLETAEEANNLLREILPICDESFAIRQHIIDTAPRNQSDRQRSTPADLRILQTICYFHQTSSSNEQNWMLPLYDFKKHSTEQPPWLGSYYPPAAAISGVLVMDTDIPESLLISVLPASIVSLVLISRHDKDHPLAHYLARQHFPDVKINFIPTSTSTTTTLLPPSRTRTVGLAIIRGIDSTTHEFHLLTPIPASEMEKWYRENMAVIAVRGRAEMPVWLMWDHTKNEDVESPYLTFDGAGPGKGGREWRVRRNLMRRSQQRGKK